MRNNHDCHLVMARISPFLLVAAIGVFCTHDRHTSGQEFRAHRQRARSPDPILMRWKFTTGDVLHWQATFHLLLTDDQNKQYRNELVLDYQWFVESVDSQGTAILEITFDRIQDRSEWSGFAFDTRSDGPFMLFDGEDAAMRLIYKYRAMKASKMMVAATSRGAFDSELVGDECVAGSYFYAPGAMPALPESEVKVGDSWSVKTESGPGVIESRGRSKYRLQRTELVDGDLICHLEGVTRSLIQPRDLIPSPKLQVASTSRFNVDLGHLESETLKSHFQAQFEPGETVSLRATVKRKLLRRGKRDGRQNDTGEFIFSMDGKSPQPLILNGVPVAQAAEATRIPRKALLLDFYHHWVDKDQNQKPGPGELRGISTKFFADEPVRLMVDSNGLKDEKLFFVVISGDGTPLFRSDIPIKGNDWFSLLNIGKRDPGIYFFEFFLNEKHLIRVPIQVCTKLERTIVQ